MFQSLANKGDWTAQEAFDHLVPESLQGDPQHVTVWMNGGEITTTEWVPARGRAGGSYEEVTRELPDRDCSRIEAGGEYSVENTIMEDMSDNRARQAADITPDELEEIKQTNAMQAEWIEEMLDIEDPHTVLEDLEEVADVALLGEAAEIASGFLEVACDFLAPVAGGVWAGKTVADRCKTTADKVGYGSMATGGTIAVLMTPPGQLAIGGYLLYRVGKRGHAFWKKRQARMSK
jgi:hypothetical protein